MEPSPVPYNLRSRGRAVGARFLRRRGVLVDGGSRKPYSRRRPKPKKVYNGWTLPEDPLSKEERKAVREREFRYFLKQRFPYPLWAMKHYNKDLKEDDHYRVSKLAGDICIYYSKLGFLRLLHFEGQPKSRENSPNSSVDDLTKHFFARVHELPNGKTHVSDCNLYEDPPKSGTPIAKTIPVRCLTCNLMDEAAFKSKSMELRLQAEARKAEEAQISGGGEDDPDSDYDDHGLKPCNCEAIRPVGKSGRSSLRGGQKLRAEAPSEGGTSESGSESYSSDSDSDSA